MPVVLPEWPDFGLADDIRPTLSAAVEAGQASALVTLFAVEGGGPRPPGTQMLFSNDMVTGFLSGGCVEGDVAGHAARPDACHALEGEGDLGLAALENVSRRDGLRGEIHAETFDDHGTPGGLRVVGLPHRRMTLIASERG